MSKIKDIYTKLVNKLDTSEVGKWIKKFLAMITLLLLMGGCVCILASIKLLNMSFVPAFACVMVCMASFDEIWKAIKTFME